MVLFWLMPLMPFIFLPSCLTSKGPEIRRFSFQLISTLPFEVFAHHLGGRSLGHQPVFQPASQLPSEEEEDAVGRLILVGRLRNLWFDAFLRAFCRAFPLAGVMPRIPKQSDHLFKLLYVTIRLCVIVLFNNYLILML